MRASGGGYDLQAAADKALEMGAVPVPEGAREADATAYAICICCLRLPCESPLPARITQPADVLLP